MRLGRVAMAALTSSATLMSQKIGLSSYRLVLASQSPRRREIFDLMGLDFEVIVSGFAEDLDKALYRGDGGPPRYAEDNAVLKALSVAERVASEEGGDRCTIVVGSDTIFDLDGEILEKPATPEQAREMLRRLSGRTHVVHSGVGIFLTSQDLKEPATRFTESTRVTFGNLSEADIGAYVASGEPMDKSGSYGIQGLGGQFVEGIEGCYFNVMGFPMRRFSVALSSVIAIA